MVKKTKKIVQTKQPTNADIMRALSCLPGMKQDISGLKQDVSGLKQNIASLKENQDLMLKSMNDFAQNTEMRFDQVDARFEQMDIRFDHVDSEISALKTSHQEIQLRQDNVPYRFEFTALERRVKKLEKVKK